MGPYLRRVATVAGVTAVRVVAKVKGRRQILEHLGSTHNDVDLAALIAEGNQRLHPGQLEFELDPPGRALTSAKTRRLSSQVLWDVLEAAWRRLGFNCVDDEAFMQLVLARLIELTSKLDTIRVLDEIGVQVPRLSTIKSCLKTVIERDLPRGCLHRLFRACACPSGWGFEPAAV